MWLDAYTGVWLDAGKFETEKQPFHAEQIFHRFRLFLKDEGSHKLPLASEASMAAAGR